MIAQQLGAASQFTPPLPLLYWDMLALLEASNSPISFSGPLGRPESRDPIVSITQDFLLSYWKPRLYGQRH